MAKKELKKEQLDKVTGGIYQNMDYAVFPKAATDDGKKQYFVRLHYLEDNSVTDWYGPYTDKESAQQAGLSIPVTKVGQYSIEVYPED